LTLPLGSGATESGGQRVALPPDSIEERARSPHEYYERLRRRGPVNEITGGNGEVVSTIVDGVEVIRALRDESFSVHMATDFGRLRPIIPQQIDPPEHRRYRRHLDPLLRRNRVELMDPLATEEANHLIDQFQGDGGCEFRRQFAIPFSGALFMELMGLPRADLSFLTEAKENILKPRGSSVAEQRLNQAEWAASLESYFEDVVRSRGKGTDGTSFISQLIASEVDDEKLNDDEIIDVLFQLPLASLDTVSATLVLMWAFLGASPEHQAAVRSGAATTEAAVEELMRYLSPVSAAKRFASRDTVVAGCPIPADQRTFIAISSANCDPAIFPDPDIVDFGRERNHHYSFGGGPHRCLGIHFARFELGVAMREWHGRIPSYSCAASEDLHYSDVNLARVIDALHLSWKG
jgi:cytochrome P450